MISKAFVWGYLPGDGEPTLCGAFEHQPTSAGVKVGTFVYGKSYLSNPDALALDPVALPLGSRAFSTAALGGVFGVLSDATPDDWGRYVVDKHFGPQDYPVGYMLHPMDDAIGNLAFSASPDERPAHHEPLDSKDIALVRRVLLGLEQGEALPTQVFQKIRPNTALGGARPKLTVCHEGELWLAKFPSARDDPALSYAPIEAAMLDLGALCDIEPAHAVVVQGDVLLVRRFDRARIASGWRRDGFLSARSILHANTAAVEPTYSGSYGRFANELSRYSADAPADRELLFRRMVFNAFISNTDDHDRNHGLLAGDFPGEYRLSPAYDLRPILHATVRKHHAMNLGRGRSEATKKNLLADHRDFGLSESQAGAIIESIETTVARHWRECLSARGVSVEGADRLARCFGSVPQDEHVVQAEIRRNNPAPIGRDRMRS